ncbi:DUF6314 family protein [Cognatishimia sp. F0-27]|uniref:DUF6314 family protein n=1 Tax=Cognatishimia sp. F0-27 TaxID=2816855 RepID=UPI001D0C2BE7|nr:DUF6314 family protein [Cognatishimia sp. F0-27]MCC1492589.1 trigger factor [Cognatishimia sp. F0-27]
MTRVLEDFRGLWRLERMISHGDGTTARFEGRAAWAAAAEGAPTDLDCVETGTLILNGQSFEAERRFRWDDTLRVWFDDGRFFHQVPPEGGTAAHWCDPDQYDAAYDFSGWPGWCCTWRVRGPRKDYRMVSRYERISA